MSRKRFRLELKRDTLQLGDRTLVIHVLKLPRLAEANEPFRELDVLAAEARRAAENGADVIDLSAMSLHPDRFPVSAEVELRSVTPMVRRLRRDGLGFLCVTTTHAVVAEKALQAGADLINDPSGLKLDPDLAPVVSHNDGGLIVAHMRETPPVWAQLPPLPDAVGDAVTFLKANINRALRAGIPRTRILADPGLSLGKRKEDNMQLLSQLHRLQDVEYPIVLTYSGKPLTTEAPEGASSAAELAVAAMAIQAGVHAIRGRFAAEARAVANTVDALTLARNDLRESSARRPSSGPRPPAAPRHPLVDEEGARSRRGSLPPLRPRPRRP